MIQRSSCQFQFLNYHERRYLPYSLAMPCGIIALPDEFRKLLELVQRVNSSNFRDESQPANLFSSIKLNGRANICSKKQSAPAFTASRRFVCRKAASCTEGRSDRSRYDISELSRSSVLTAGKFDFATACKKLDFLSAARLLRAGFDSSKANDFARARCEFKVKPLIGFYNNHPGVSCAR
jgi:hypothetical protein